jgi:hypothetical protein
MDEQLMQCIEGIVMKEILLANNRGVALVDDDMYDFLMQWRWQSHPEGYVIRTEKRKTIAMHRVLMNPPNGMQVDHINHIKSDNQRANLRICTKAENMFNHPQAVGISGYRGVCQSKSAGKWDAYIKVNRKRIYLGTYIDPIEAAVARDRAAMIHHGAFAILNFPPALPSPPSDHLL